MVSIEQALTFTIDGCFEPKEDMSEEQNKKKARIYSTNFMLTNSFGGLGVSPCWTYLS